MKNPNVKLVKQDVPVKKKKKFKLFTIALHGYNYFYVWVEEIGIVGDYENVGNVIKRAWILFPNRIEKSKRGKDSTKCQQYLIGAVFWQKCYQGYTVKSR